jgi:hypothetical protein
LIQCCRSLKQAKIVDVDALLSKEKAEICVVHDKFMVYVATFSIDVCRHIYSVAAQTTNVSAHSNQEILRHGIKAVGNSVQMQTFEEAVYAVNFGATVRPQQSALCSKSKHCQEINQTLGVQQEDGISQTLPIFYFPLPHQCVSSTSQTSYQSILIQIWIKATQQKKRRMPRFTSGNRLEHSKQYKLPAPLLSSMPTKADNELVAAAIFESGV